MDRTFNLDEFEDVPAGEEFATSGDGFEDVPEGEEFTPEGDPDTITLTIDPADKEKAKTGSFDDAESFGAANAEWNRLGDKYGRDFAGRPVIDGKVVPAPSPTISGMIDDGLEAVTGYGLPFGLGDQKVKTGIAQLSEGALQNTAGFLAQTGAAISDKIDDAVLTDEAQDKATELTPLVDKYRPAEMEPGTVVDSLLMTGASAVGGGAGGAAIAGKVIDSLPLIRNVTEVQKLGKFLGFNVGSAASLDNDTETAAIGPNSALGKVVDIPILRGVDTTKGDSYADKILRERANILLDGVIVGTAAEKTLQAGLWTGKFIAGSTFGAFMPLFSKSAKESQIFDDVVQQLVDPVVLKDPEARQAAVDRIAGVIKENKEVVIGMGDGAEDVKIGLDTLAALQKGLKDNDEEGVKAIMARINGMRAGAVTKNSPLLMEKAAGVNRAVDDTTSQMETLFGGQQGIDDAATGIRKSGDDEFGEIQGAIKEGQQAITDRQGDVVELLRNDPTFGAKIKRMDSSVDVDGLLDRDNAATEITNRIKSGYETMTAEKDTLFNAIPDGAEFDVAGFGSKLKEVGKALDAFDTSGSQAMSKSLMRTISSAYKPRVVGTDASGEAVKETAEEVIDRISQSGVDFKTLYNDVRPALTGYIDDLFAQGQGRAAGRIMELRRNIDEDQLNYLVMNGDDEAADAAQLAMDYYKGTYAPIWRDGALEKAANTFQSTRLKPVEMDTQMKDLLQTSTSNDRGAYGKQIVDFLARPEGGHSQELIGDYIVGGALQEIRGKLAGGASLTDIDPSDIFNSLTQKGTILRNLPDQKARIEGVITQLKNTKGDVNRLQSYTDELIEAGKVAQDRIYNQELGSFFKTQGVREPNGYKAFSDILSNEQSGDVIDGLLKRADQSGNPVIRDGMKAAYARHLRGKVLGTVEDTTGTRQVNGSVIVKNKEGLQSLLTYGRQIFSDNPATMDGIETILETSGAISRAKNAKPLPGQSGTSFYTDSKSKLDYYVTMMFGTINSTGARIRRVGTNVLQKLSPDTEAAAILDQMLADPDYFIANAQKYGTSKDILSPAATNEMFRFLVRANLYNEQDEGDFNTALMNTATKGTPP